MKDFKSKIENYWYHYKWHTLVALFFIITITVMIVQAATVETADIYIIYAGPDILTEKEREDIVDSFNQIVKEDINNDGKSNVDLLDLIIMNTTQLKEAHDKGYNEYFLNQKVIADNRETLNTQTLAGDYIILLIDPELYKNMKDNGVLADLESVGVTDFLGDADETNGTKVKQYDECAVYFKSLEYAKFYSAFDTLPDNTLICIRKMSTTSITSSKASKVEKYYNAHLAFFKEIFAFEPPQ